MSEAGRKSLQAKLYHDGGFLIIFSIQEEIKKIRWDILIVDILRIKTRM